MTKAAEHSGRLLARAGREMAALAPGDPQRTIMASWQRCLNDHGLQPDRVARPTVVTQAELRDYQAPLEDLIALSRGEIERLHGRLADHDYLVMLADPNGVAVHFRCVEPLAAECRRVDVLPGSVWLESRQGTSGIGVCITERVPVSVVMDEHFASWLAPLSCTVAPIFGAEGQLAAVLNVTTLRPTDHRSQAMAREIVVSSARRIENLYFDRLHAKRRVVRVSRHDDFCDAAAEARLALDDAGRIVDATPEAMRLLGNRASELVARLDAGQSDVISEGSLPVFLRMAESTPAPTAMAARTARAQPGFGDMRRPAASRPARSLERGLQRVDPLAGEDPVLAERIRMARRFVDLRLPVMLQGETGSGKSLLARALHEASVHREGAFVSINCAAIPAELIESELFGYRAGAFTGAARQGARGRLLEADGGTLFLDEIGDMPLALQSRLLHVLSDGEFVPLGATRPVSVAFAVISASLHDIAARVREGRFREDLFYRLAGATVVLPSLRQRSDRQLLIARCLTDEAVALGLPAPTLAPDAMRALDRHAWPGNLRELRHVARFALAMADGGHVDLHCLPAPLGSESPPIDDERHRIEACLRQAGWNVSDAARALGVSRATLHRRIHALGLVRP